MTFAKASALVLGFLGAMALGVWIGPHITDRGGTTESPAAQVSQPSRAAAKSRPAPRTSREASARAATSAISPSAPELHERLKPLLNRGAKMAIAADGFRDAEQFAALAHAARNTEVPFLVLKHRVLTERKSLARAIGESKPDLNAKVEAERAMAEARSDIAALGG